MRSTTNTKQHERRGEVLEVARDLLAGGRIEEVLSQVTQLVEQNHELTTRVALATTRAEQATTRAGELQKQLDRFPENFLFAGSDAGGERAAIAYTILGCCRIAGIDPVAYLSDVLPQLTRRIRLIDLPDLLPARWQTRRGAVAMPAV